MPVQPLPLPQDFRDPSIVSLPSYPRFDALDLGGRPQTISESWAHKDKSQERKGRGRRGNFVSVSVCICEGWSSPDLQGTGFKQKMYFVKHHGIFLG